MTDLLTALSTARSSLHLLKPRSVDETPTYQSLPWALAGPMQDQLRPSLDLRGPQPRPTPPLVLPQNAPSTNCIPASCREAASAYHPTHVRSVRVEKAQGDEREREAGEGKGKIHRIRVARPLTRPSNAAQKDEMLQELSGEPSLDSSAKEIACDHLM